MRKRNPNMWFQEARKVADDPDASGWLKNALLEAINRDPMNAADDALALCRILQQRAEAVLKDALDRSGVPAEQLEHIIHGTTLVTNSLIERKGSKTALLTTKGFKDAVEIGREHRYDLYDVFLEMPTPLVPRYLRLEVDERDHGSCFLRWRRSSRDDLVIGQVDHFPPTQGRASRQPLSNRLIAISGWVKLHLHA